MHWARIPHPKLVRLLNILNFLHILVLQLALVCVEILLLVGYLRGPRVYRKNTALQVPSDGDLGNGASTLLGDFFEDGIG